MEKQKEGKGQSKGRKAQAGSSWPRAQLSRIEFTCGLGKLRQHIWKDPRMHCRDSAAL